MSAAIAVGEDELRAAHRALNEPISFDAMRDSPALVICLRNLAEINARRRAGASSFEVVNEPSAALPRFELRQARRREQRIGKVAAANDLDD